MVAKKNSKKTIDAEIKKEAAKNEEKGTDSVAETTDAKKETTEISKPAGDPICPFLDKLNGAKFTGPFKYNMQPIERIAQVQTVSGTFSIPVSLFAAEWDGEIKELSTRKEMSQWLRDQRKASREGNTSGTKMQRFEKRSETVMKKLAVLQETAPTEEIKSRVSFAILQINEVLSEIVKTDKVSEE